MNALTRYTKRLMNFLLVLVKYNNGIRYTRHRVINDATQNSEKTLRNGVSIIGWKLKLHGVVRVIDEWFPSLKLQHRPNRQTFNIMNVEKVACMSLCNSLISGDDTS